jgi:hypothetical protein
MEEFNSVAQSNSVVNQHDVSEISNFVKEFNILAQSINSVVNQDDVSK